MPTYDSFCRAPLVAPVYVALPDTSVHVEGALDALFQQALQTVDLAALSPLDAVLATKLGGYTDLPPMPNLKAAQAYLPGNPRAFLDAVRAGLMIAAASKNKSAMLDVLDAMRALTDALPSVRETDLLPVGADALRAASELYRRTGQKFLLTLMERLRSQLPDVSGMFHSFPFLKPFVPEAVAEDAMDEASQYFRRMRLLGTGRIAADSLAITAELALYSGSARDASASKAGVAALQRYHGMPQGAFSADPYLAGRDPSRGVELEALCAQLEALHDLLCASGDVALAERMQRITENALANAFIPGGLCAVQAVNRFADDENAEPRAAALSQSTALLRAMHALRRSLWMLRSDLELAMLLPYDSCCLARMDGIPVRVMTTTSGMRLIHITLETKQPVEFTLSLHVPGYAQSATLSINGAKPESVECGRLHSVKRLFKTGDTLDLQLVCEPFVETGYRGSVGVYFGPLLMALPLPDADAAWQYALDEETALSMTWENARPRVQVDACVASEWQMKAGVMPPPPQGVGMGDAYELTLLPYAETVGRVAAFPQARRA